MGQLDLAVASSDRRRSIRGQLVANAELHSNKGASRQGVGPCDCPRWAAKGDAARDGAHVPRAAKHIHATLHAGDGVTRRYLRAELTPCPRTTSVSWHVTHAYT
eukprot:7389031-Prymnesium_polylepis.3